MAKVKDETDEVETGEESQSLTGSGAPPIKVRANVNIRDLAVGDETEVPNSLEVQRDIAAGYLSRIDG